MTGYLGIACVLILLTTQTALAARISPEIPYFPQKFYDEVESGLSGKPLIESLHEVLASAHIPGNDHDTLAKGCGSQSGCYMHTSLGYNGARKLLFGELHLVKQGSKYGIFDVYCEKIKTDTDFNSRPPRPGAIPDPNVMNAEHTWPQSRFSGKFNKGLQKSDLHILFPVDSNANSSRGNIEFGDVVTEKNSPCPASKRGFTARGGTGTYFEVPDAHKGNVARAIFYFSVRYRIQVSENEEESLRSWHRQDPVDNDESERNEKIFASQRVRNPFIDHPDLVELIQDF